MEFQECGREPSAAAPPQSAPAVPNDNRLPEQSQPSCKATLIFLRAGQINAQNQSAYKQKRLNPSQRIERLMPSSPSNISQPIPDGFWFRDPFDVRS